MKFFKKGQLVPEYIFKTKNPNMQKNIVFGCDSIVKGKNIERVVNGSKCGISIGTNKRINKQSPLHVHKKVSFHAKNVKMYGAWCDYGIWIKPYLI